jgi:hypothetical protein
MDNKLIRTTAIAQDCDTVAREGSPSSAIWKQADIDPDVFLQV